jgi:cobalt transporter subunit CbtB
MSTTRLVIGTVSSTERFTAGLIALVLGMGLLVGVGFAGSQVVHNAAHDTRHAIGFPCH